MDSKKTMMIGMAAACFFAAFAFSGFWPDWFSGLLILLFGVGCTYFMHLSQNRLQAHSELDKAWQKANQVLKREPGKAWLVYFLEEIKRSSGYERAVIEIFMPEVLGFSPEEEEGQDWSIANIIIKQNKTVLLARRQIQPELFTFLDQEVNDFLGIPLVFDEQVGAVVYLINEDKDNSYGALTERRLKYLREESEAVLNNQWKLRQQKAGQVELLTILAALWEPEHAEMQGHSQRVAELSALLGRKLSFNEEERENLYIAALLHDVGCARLLSSSGEQEGPESTKQHPDNQEHAIKGAELFPTGSRWEALREAILSHHEHYNGSGQPQGLMNIEIPLFARIIAVADYYDAFVMAYREEHEGKSPAHEEAAAALKKGTGSYFDPLVVVALEEIERKEIQGEHCSWSAE